MARRAQSAASWLAAGLGWRQQADRRQRLSHLGQAAGQERGAHPGELAAAQHRVGHRGQQKLAGGRGRAVLAADRGSGRPGQVDADAPARADRHIEPPGARRRHRGEVEHARLVPAALDDLQGEPVAPALVVGHPGAAERREAGLGRGGTTGGAGRGPPGADEAGGDGGAVRREHESLNVYLAPVAVPLRREHQRRPGRPDTGRRAHCCPAPRRRRPRLRRVHPARSGPGWPGPRGHAGRGRPARRRTPRPGGRRGPAEHVHLPQGTQHRADPVQADFLRRLAGRFEVLVQPPVPG